jgi:monofunctional biosynthetic peptidoglycan transglycosylase
MTPTTLVTLDPPDRREWLVVNDNVMGGRSLGGLEFTRRSVVFTGSLNTDGGGFASIRTRGLLTALAPFREIVLRVQDDGRAWACDFRAQPSPRGFGVTWKATFATEGDRATIVRLPLDAFRPTWRGQRVPADRIPPDEAFPAAMESVGFTIADGRDGPFRLEVLAIEGE